MSRHSRCSIPTISGRFAPYGTMIPGFSTSQIGETAPVHIEFGVAKVSKYATSESGDTVEMIERPHGGLSVVLVDGQSSGRGAKMVSNIVARKAVSLLGEGVRDGAAARAAHDYLRTHRGGRVSAELQIISVDLVSRTLVVSRNARCPAFVAHGGEVRALDSESEPIGIHISTKPVIVELPMEPETYVVAASDGVMDAGWRRGEPIDVPGMLGRLAAECLPAQAVADALLDAALAADDYRPGDDVSVVVAAVLSEDVPHSARRFAVSFPV